MWIVDLDGLCIVCECVFDCCVCFGGYLVVCVFVFWIVGVCLFDGEYVGDIFDVGWD